MNKMTYEEGYQQGRTDALNEMLEKVREYGSVWMAYNDGMTKEEIAERALRGAKNSIIIIIEGMLK